MIFFFFGSDGEGVLKQNPTKWEDEPRYVSERIVRQGGASCSREALQGSVAPRSAPGGPQKWPISRQQPGKHVVCPCGALERTGWMPGREVLGVSTSRERWAGRGLSDHFIWRGQTWLYIELIYMCFKQDTGVFVLASALISTWRSCLLLLNTF